ncbi:MAG: hypothetical protein HKN91_04690, partial [Acidimicrobiia bacterium]|nr:hypothetical protein [Acidimicrobiia bacterium]
ARLAAIEAGVIGENEDLPNDFFIVNEEQKYELLKVRNGTLFTLLDANDPGNQIQVNGERLQQVYAGEDIGQPIYGIVPGTAFAMNITVAGGLISQGDAVYLP